MGTEFILMDICIFIRLLWSLLRFHQVALWSRLLFDRECPSYVFAFKCFFFSFLPHGRFSYFEIFYLYFFVLSIARLLLSTICLHFCCVLHENKQPIEKKIKARVQSTRCWHAVIHLLRITTTKRNEILWLLRRQKWMLK